MEKDLKKKWIKALESGKYKQATEELCDPHGAMCCLGVLMYVAEGPDIFEHELIKRHRCSGQEDLPSHLCEKYGIQDTTGKFEFDSLTKKLQEKLLKYIVRASITYESLVNLNDMGVPFKLIAKVIKQESKGLFTK